MYTIDSSQNHRAKYGISRTDTTDLVPVTAAKEDPIETELENRAKQLIKCGGVFKRGGVTIVKRGQKEGR